MNGFAAHVTLSRHYRDATWLERRSVEDSRLLPISHACRHLARGASTATAGGALQDNLIVPFFL
jgi:hypothetical protein